MCRVLNLFSSLAGGVFSVWQGEINKDKFVLQVYQMQICNFNK